MDVILRPAAGGGTWRPALRPLGHGRPMRLLRPLGDQSPPPAAWDRATWVARLLARYGVDQGAWLPLAAVLWRVPSEAAPTAGGGAQARRPLAPLTPWPLALTLRLVTPAGRAALPTARADAPEFVGPLGTRTTAPAAAGRLLETLVTRLQRRDRLTTWRESSLVVRLLARQETGADAALPLPPPAVPRVVSQPAAALAALAAQRSPAAEPLAPPAYWDEPPRPTPPPLMDVERLTDQVVRTIDQRMVAARERFGGS
jgi:hypothetical protein